MKRRISPASLRYGPQYLGLLLCGALFLCGCIAGTLSSGFIADPDGLGPTLTDYLMLAEPGAARGSGFLSAFLDASKYHLLSICFGFSLLGVFFLPAMSAVRGFFFCFSASTLVRFYGGSGVLLALVLFGLTALVSIPCYFALSCQSFTTSLHLLRNTFGGKMAMPPNPFGISFVRRCAVCMIFTIGAFLVEKYIMSMLVGKIALQLSTG